MSIDNVRGLQPYLDEDPGVINHLLWGFLGINLTGAARDIFGNGNYSNWLEAWRKLYRHIFINNEQRKAELHRQVHSPVRQKVRPTWQQL